MEEENGTKHYSIVNIINLKDSIDWKVISKQVESLSFEEEGMMYLRLTDKGTAGKARIYPGARRAFVLCLILQQPGGSGACGSFRSYS